ncbi:Envoplakin [Dissostichus eleginoides]|uniref:Envoplakin n=1 Tax=Dissostichus eleginoides TaxID=100907 RepID=A0AAD9EUJ1_DISEL|nr:Envoplakin [Dissostichus eleginoides]
MSITEFSLLVAGEPSKPVFPPIIHSVPRSPIRTTPPSPLNYMPSSLRSSFPSLNSQYNSSTQLNSHNSGSLSNLTSTAGDEYFPISGILDTTTESRMSVRSALTRKLIDADTALKLLEAQAASGGIVDLAKKDKLSVHNAAERGLIDTSDMHKLLNAQKAFTGVEDPMTKDRLAVGPAASKGYIPQENARSKTADELQDETTYKKELVDPITKEKISYKQAMDRCKIDNHTGLLLLPAASTDATDAPSYSNYRFSSNKY